MRPDIFIVAAEPSGDALGASLAKSLRGRVDIQAIGGPALADAGYPSAMSTDGLAVLGFTEGLRALPHVLRKVREAADLILAADPRAVVLIDSWGFMIRLAKRLKAKGYEGHVVKYVSPQVWATRPGRAKVLARHVDHLLSTQPMDAPCYAGTGLPLTYVGNPVLDGDYRSGDAAAFCARHGLDPAKPILGIFPGSRESELQRLSKALAEQLDTIRASVPDVQDVWVISDAVSAGWREELAELAQTLVRQDEMADAMAAMDAALAVSGTITTQLACAGVPTVVVYRLSPLTYAVAKRLFRPSHISIVNIAADASLMPEFMQDDAEGPGVAKAVVPYLTDTETRAAASEALIAQTDAMGAGQQNASDRAAEALLAILDEGSV